MDAAFRAMEAIRLGAEKEGRAMTEEELAKRAAHKAEIEAAQREWDDFKAEEELRKSLYGEGEGRAIPPEDGGNGRVTVEDQPIYRGSAASALGQQLMDVKAMVTPNLTSNERSQARSRLEQTQKRNQALLEKQAEKEGRAAGTGGFTTGVPSDGGFFLQGETSVELMTHGFNNSEVLSRCQSRTMNPGTQFIEVIGIDETSRANGSRGGGIVVYSNKELGTVDPSKTKFNKIRIEPTKLTGFYNASSEMLENVTFLGQEMRQLFGEEFAFKCQDLVIRGTGAGEALGILGADCLISQAKETGQKADTIVTANILNMETKIWREQGAVYLVNRETKPQLATLSQPIGTGGVLVPLYKTENYMGNRISTLNGFPCITIEQCAALGDKGDIILADFSQYITANKGDINEAMSIHVYFLYDQSTFRFIYFFDGQPRWKSSITPYKGASGAKVGPFVTLDARA